MTWSDFNATVMGYLNRTATDIPMAGSVSLVVVAANMAKAEAQRRHHFKMARTQAYISSSMAGADLMSAAFTTPSSAVVVPVKKVEQVWLFSPSTPFYRTLRVPSMTLGDLKNDYRTNSMSDVFATAPINYANSGTRWYIQGTKLYLMGVTTPVVQVALDVVQWMPDYDGTITDFFLSFHLDWMVLKTVDNLNRYLKEDQRTQISNSDLEKRWISVTAFDENYAEDNFEAGANE